MKTTLILNAEQLIKNANDNIEMNINVLCPDNAGLCAQNILSQLRNLIDAFALLQYQIDYPDLPPMSGSERIKKAVSNLKANSKRFDPFIKMYEYIEMIASHYTQDQFGSVALLQKYSDLLLDLKQCAKKEFEKDILNNLNKFPFEIDDHLKDFYFSIYKIIKGLPIIVNAKISTFYVERKRRRYLSNSTFIYEYVLSPANDKKTKFDRLTAFSLLNINKTLSIKCSIYNESVDVFGIKTNISIINDYSISVRPCELKRFAYLEGFEGFNDSFKRDSAGYQQLMSFLTVHKMTIYDIIMLDDQSFNQSVREIQGSGSTNSVIEFLIFTREIIKKRDVGFKTLTYLLYLFRHKVMKYQATYSILDSKLGNTNLSESCKLFEISPFSFSLRKHNPSIEDLLGCLSEFCTPDQLLKRRIIYNTEINKTLFSSIEDLNKDYLSKDYIELFNNRLTEKTIDNSLLVTPDERFVYAKGYVDDTTFILNYLKKKATDEWPGYRALAENYLATNPDLDIDEVKKGLLKRAFINSGVIIINGAAGTGKTTTITHLSNVLASEKVLFLSCTNASVQNLRHKVGIQGNRTENDFKTIENFLQRESFSLPFYKTVVIDECSTVSNKDFYNIINKKDFDRLILVGDEEQIESIRFGNWFGIARFELDCSFELSDNHRAQEHNLSVIWKEARNYGGKLFELLMSGGYLSDLNNDIFKKTLEDEVILCLNYDGLYGINNINHYMQEINPGKGVSWGVWSFKEGDRILFNESYYFRDYFYNNQKGTIVSINEIEDKVVFKIKVKKEDYNRQISNNFVRYLKDESEEYDFYEIFIDKNDDNDDEESNKILIVPFQLGYALSIHKAQGLEYDSVKMVLTEDSEDAVSHNIFYTAITRCRKKLMIFCNPESLNNILSSYQKTDYSRDSKIIKSLMRRI